MEPVSPQPSSWVTQAASDRLTQADNDVHSYNKRRIKLPAPSSFFNPWAYNSFSQKESESIAFPPEDSSEEPMCEEGTDSDNEICSLQRTYRLMQQGEPQSDESERKDLTLQIKNILPWNSPEAKTKWDNRFLLWQQIDPPIFDDCLIPIDNGSSPPGDIAPPASPRKEEEDRCLIQ